MAQSIFTVQIPAILDGDDGTDYTLGTEFSRSTDGSITHGRAYFGTVAPMTAVFVLYDVNTETEITRAEFLVKTPGWQTVELPSPVPYTAGTSLVASYYTTTEYVATASFFSGDLVNDDITAPGATNGRLGNTDQYPSIVSGNNASFFADIAFAEDGQTANVGTAIETDSAIALGRSKSRAVVTATETDVAVALTRSKSRTVGRADETDAAQPLGRSKVRSLGTATETDATFTLGRTKTRLIGTATETDTALPVGGGESRNITVHAGRPRLKWRAATARVKWRVGQLRV